ncbi:TPA: MFS transporter [Raoultella ornithinolytica]|uniref:MFS transporter n=1 Tax=Raoultella ornithinolytica TaxID=54291 RepID=UPI0004D7F6D2|nr:MFS transporter [Raoultella ornithinolytica]KDV93225.1 major Facilitator Superfamily protein [Raoultella ornithinolytica 2-156-04_S1_C1]KDX15690.1 major Facilitator Superfamily protein [Raoultella ornithinolytica 2-156-04_S1_C2]MDV0599790.1 MFS transporter [Raoultella ornithinolytica]PQH32167.1 MFS transporter [Raoultella ornithinolytica]QQO49416.1 MFS transporter [Raoultella ornithinolytica]
MFNPDQNRLAPTLAMIMAASLVGFITGYTVPLISLELAQQQIDTVYVGLLAALPPAGMMISSFLSPALCRRFEMGTLLTANLILLALATIASCLTVDLLPLLLPRFLTGIASGVIIVLGESWITGGAAGKNRATLTGIYASAFTGCQLAGPLLISAGADYQIWVLLAVVGLTAACLLMLRHLPSGSRESLSERASWRSLGAFLPVLASGVFCFAFFDASILALLPLYGMDKGLNEAMAVLLVTIVLTGDAFFQAPLGWVADKFGIRRVHLSCAAVFCLALVALPFLLASPVQLIVGCLILGAAAGALYTLSLVRAGKTFSGQKLIMINALLGFFWSAGSVAGPVVSSLLISVSGYDGLLIALLACGVLFLLIQCLGKTEKALLANERQDRDDDDAQTETA